MFEPGTELALCVYDNIVNLTLDLGILLQSRVKKMPFFLLPTSPFMH